MSHTEYQELLAAYALDALDARDAQALGEHLATCAECRGELDSLRDASGLLAHAPSFEAPSAELRDRILAAVKTDGRSQNAVEKGATVTPIRVREKPAWPTYLWRIAAAVVLFVLIGMWVVAQYRIAQLTAAREDARYELAREREARQRDEEVLAVLTSRDAKMIQLAGTQTAKDASAMFVFDQKSGRAVLMTKGLPAAAADKAYEVWFIPKGRAPMPGKVFSVDSSGHAMLMDQMPAEAMNNAVIAITIEPKSGSSAPTGAIYLASPAS
jgi:anti-sigma-K factor RskA